jgi:hypothetical protein
MVFTMLLDQLDLHPTGASQGDLHLGVETRVDGFRHSGMCLDQVQLPKPLQQEQHHGVILRMVY